MVYQNELKITSCLSGHFPVFLFMCCRNQTKEKHLEGHSVLKPASGKYLHENCKSEIVRFGETSYIASSIPFFDLILKQSLKIISCLDLMV